MNDIVEEMIIEKQIKQTFNQQKISTEYTTSSGRTARERNIFYSTFKNTEQGYITMDSLNSHRDDFDIYE